MSQATDPTATEIELDIAFQDGHWLVRVKGAGEVTADNLDQAVEVGEAEARRAGLLTGDEFTLAWSTSTTPEIERLVQEALTSDAEAEASIERAYDDAVAAVHALKRLGVKKRDIADLLNIEKSAVTDYLTEEPLDD